MKVPIPDLGSGLRGWIAKDETGTESVRAAAKLREILLTFLLGMVTGTVLILLEMIGARR